MKKSRVPELMLALYLAALLRITVFRDGCFTHGWCAGRVEWVPFVYLAYLVRLHVWGYFLFLVVGNLLWFLPWGIWLGYRGARWYVALLCGMGLSALIEAAQFLLGSGVSEVEDVILNTAGTLLGYGIFFLLNRKRPLASGRKT